jgi:D-galactose 1-dehydrogenase
MTNGSEAKMAGSRIRIAIVGLGKIARDQHLPALAANPGFDFAAVASPNNRLEGKPSYSDLAALLNAERDVSAVSLCTTPQVRFDVARYALEHDCHVLLEKPPGVTVSEVLALVAIAKQRRLTLFASWHSRHAPAVEPARRWLDNRKISSITINWKEDVRVWHPGQKWIWQAGGLGVFDPGINALSILTRIVPDAIVLKDAALSFPKNCETPIAATLSLASSQGATIQVNLDFLQEGRQTWDIDIDTDAGRLTLSDGGTSMTVNDAPAPVAEGSEYPNLYAHFERLVRAREIDVDVAPLQLVADAFLCGRRTEVAAFVG